MTGAPRRPAVTTAVCTIAALAAFAANSVLCRLALGSRSIDAASFTLVRTISGALVLSALAGLRAGGSRRLAGSWPSAALLFVYLVPFSLAYVTLTTGTGALLLFGAVQVTMMTAALVSGERPSWLQWAGLGLAFAGLIVLVRPGVAAPSAAGATLMLLAGAGWGGYSVRGRRSTSALRDTAGNFARATPLVGIAWAGSRSTWHGAESGLLLAIVSGAVTSGVGYAIWYVALRGLTATRAAIVQLVVPVLAASYGIAFMGERLTARLAVAAVVVSAGVLLGIAGRQREASRSIR